MSSLLRPGLCTAILISSTMHRGCVPPCSCPQLRTRILVLPSSPLQCENLKDLWEGVATSTTSGQILTDLKSQREDVCRPYGRLTYDQEVFIGRARAQRINANNMAKMEQSTEVQTLIRMVSARLTWHTWGFRLGISTILGPIAVCQTDF